MSKLAAVFDNVTIKVKWLLHPFQGNLTCTLNAGDGHVIDNYSPEEWVLSFCVLQQHIIDVNNMSSLAFFQEDSFLHWNNIL